MVAGRHTDRRPGPSEPAEPTAPAADAPPTVAAAAGLVAATAAGGGGRCQPGPADATDLHVQDGE